jgi:putative PIN family toxin of toxin-antitoxin system
MIFSVRIVLDTSVLVAAIRSKMGASRILLDAALAWEVQFCISTPLILEYEAVLTRPEHPLASGISSAEVVDLVDMLCDKGVQVELTETWLPILRDPCDEMVLNTAINGRVDAIVTFNRADFAGIPEAPGIDVQSPGEALRRIR